MSSTDEAPEQARDGEQPAASADAGERVWTPPQRSDQAPGEEVVQVNDQYSGGGPPPDDEARGNEAQHPTGG